MAPKSAAPPTPGAPDRRASPGRLQAILSWLKSWEDALDTSYSAVQDQRLLDLEKRVLSLDRQLQEIRMKAAEGSK